jgi:hypothetical protein
VCEKGSCATDWACPNASAQQIDSGNVKVNSIKVEQSVRLISKEKIIITVCM